MNVLDFATLTVSSSAVDLTSASPAINSSALKGKVRRALITVEDDQIRWRADGTAPAGTCGHLVNNGDVMNLVGADFKSVLEAIQFIRVTTDAELYITYFD